MSYDGPDHDFRWFPIGHFREWPVTLCEAAVGKALPSFSTRRAWRELLGEPSRSGIVVFADAARLRYVWCWRDVSGACLEYHIPGRASALTAALLSLPHEHPSSNPKCPGDSEAPAIVLGALSLWLQGLSLPLPDTMGGWIALIENTDQPALLGSLWRRLSSFRVLDRGAASGRRLRLIGELLAPIYHSLLSRIQSYVDDASASADGAARSSVRLRRLFQPIEEGPYGDTPHLFIRRWLVQRVLHALVPDVAARRLVRRELLAFGGIEDEALWRIDCSIGLAEADVRGPTDGPVASVTPPLNAADAPGHIEEQVTALRIAWRWTQHVRLLGLSTDEELRRAASQIYRRRRILALRMLRLRCAARDPADRHDELDLRLNFPQVSSISNFSLILD